MAAAPRTPQGFRGRLWGPLLAATVPTACVPALVTRWVLVPLLQQRRARFDVCCRVRPLDWREEMRGTTPCVSVTAAQQGESSGPSSDRGLIAPGRVTVGYDAKGQTFDSVMTGTDQALPFAVVRPYVERFVDRAEPGAVVAYGQTSAGKTHTILGDAAEGMEGAAVRGVRLVLERLAVTNGCHQSERRVLLVNMYEIYLEELRDLTPTPVDLANDADGDVDAFVASGQWAPPCHRDGAIAPDTQPSMLVRGIRKTKTLWQCGKCKELYVQSSVPLYIDSVATFDRALEKVRQQRNAVPSTYNSSSTRGHLVVSLGIASIPASTFPRRMREHGPDERSAVRAWFDFIDLAGSERVSRAGASTIQLQEIVTARRGLATLLKVIEAIVDGAEAAPIEASLLTRVLARTTFASTSRVMILLCLLSVGDFEESRSTLDVSRLVRGECTAYV